MFRSLGRILSGTALATLVLVGTISFVRGYEAGLLGELGPICVTVFVWRSIRMVCKSKPPALPMTLGLAGVLVFTLFLYESIGFGEAIGGGTLGPNGQAEARWITWATFLAFTGSVIVATVARRRGGWAVFGWWGGSFLWVFLFCVLYGPGREVSYHWVHYPFSPPPLPLLLAAGGAFASALGALLWVSRSKAAPPAWPAFLGAAGRPHSQRDDHHADRSVAVPASSSSVNAQRRGDAGSDARHRAFSYRVMRSDSAWRLGGAGLVGWLVKWHVGVVVCRRWKDRGRVARWGRRACGVRLEFCATRTPKNMTGHDWRGEPGRCLIAACAGRSGPPPQSRAACRSRQPLPGPTVTAPTCRRTHSPAPRGDCQTTCRRLPGRATPMPPTPALNPQTSTAL